MVRNHYPTVVATSRRVRQLITGEDPMVAGAIEKRPLSIVIDELYHQEVKTLPEEEATEGGEQDA